MEIKNYAQLYSGHGDEFDEEDIEKLNEWLSENEVQIEIKSDADGITVKVFKL